MESQNQGQNPNTMLSQQVHNGWFERVVRFYSRRFHFIMIPVGAIMAAVHIRYSIMYFGQCPIQPMIIFYMLVHAAVHVVVMILAFLGVITVRCIYSRDGEGSKMLGRCILIIVLISTLLLLLFSLAWVIAGSVWIFGAKTSGVQGDDPSITTTYCQQELFRIAFTLLIVNYVVHGIVIFFVTMGWICRKKQQINSSGVTIQTMNN